MDKRYITVLTVAGSDSSGGAGIQADIKTMSALGCYGMSAITAITAQNTTEVSAIQGVSADIVASQIDMVCRDIKPMATKTGMLYSADIVRAVAGSFIRNKIQNIVIDPVMVSTSGSALIDEEAVSNIVDLLFPLAILITPNKLEAKRLTGTDDIMCQAETLHRLGARNILLKGGDSSATDYKTDYLALEGERNLIEIKSPCVMTPNTHGTGCTFSSAIACFLAMGCELRQAIEKAKQYITSALMAGGEVQVGQGHGPVNHFFNPQKLIISYD